ncbi:CCAAT/enhancer-binding protein zeta [Paramormyrops kingsleyae]|uniref:CCAAT/enhancer-binding protein zeta n=1 Tax=Paramormyrops kingsleyae TaxID=1676925 RepID=UPI003B974703
MFSSMAPKRKRTKMDPQRFNFVKEQDIEKEEVEADDVCEPGKDDEEFNLQEVLRLGGTRADYAMLVSVNDCNELIDGGKKDSIDDLKEGELQDFITKLGIRAYNPLQVIQEEPDEQQIEVGKNGMRKNVEAEKTQKVPEKVQTDLQDGPQTGTTDKNKTKKSKEILSSEVPRKKIKMNANVFDFQLRQILLIKPGGKWFDLEYTNESNFTPQDESLVSKYKCLAQKLFEAETEHFKSKKHSNKGASSTWMKTVVSTGTLADRMAAMTLLIQDAPVHNLQLVENLVSQIRKKGGRRQSLMALDTLRELLMSDLLPENRKLRTFSQHPFGDLEKLSSGNRDARDRRLILWYFEHQLKHQVAEFVVSLESLAHDTVADTKAQALTTAHELLCNRPEQEKALLAQVVNKLGDPEYKMAAKASYLLDMLLHKHPNMKAVVCSEVERLMFRPNISSKAQYYAVCFLNQMVLSHDEADLASRLISIYFSFFRACIKNKDIESKMLSALLSGVNRAYPYANVGDDKIKEQLDTLFKVVHLVKFNTAIQALMLLFQVMDSQQTISDRYYVALYKKLLDPGLSQCSRHGMFLNLLYKSLKSDVVLRRVKAFVKRLLQVSCEQNPTFACGALFLVSEVMKAKPGLRVLLQDSSGCEEETFKDVVNNDDDDDEEERFTDADKVEEGQSAKPEKAKEVASWVHYQNLEGAKTLETYDPLHRNPLFCAADRTTLWELHRLCAHFHPSVALFAHTILKGDFIQYTGDPLQDFTLIRFLDRFVFRNPKQQKVRENIDSTVMQAKHKLSMSNSRALPVNSVEFLAKDESQIPVDEVFFYRFFKRREKDKWQYRRKDRDDESVEEVDDDEFEKALDSFEGDSYFTDLMDNGLDFAGNVKGKSKKKRQIEDEDDSDSDLDVDDLDDEEVSLGSMDKEDFGDELEEDGGMFMDLGGEEEEGADSEDEMNVVSEMSKASKKGRKQKFDALDFAGGLGTQSRQKKKEAKSKDNMLATAEEFGYLLDENAGLKFDNIGMDAMANRDQASLKQLKWEAQRDDWLHGRDAKTLRRKKAAFQRRKQSGKVGNKTRKK